MIKLLIVNTDLRGGGAEKVLVNLVNNLDNSKYDITLFTIFKEGVNRKDLSPEIKQKWYFEKPFKGYSRLALLFSPEFLYRTFIKDDYDVVISYLEGFPSRIVSGCTNKKTKLISWIHLELYKDTISYEFRNYKEALKVYNKFNKIVCVAESVKNCFQKSSNIPSKSLEVIYNMLDLNDIKTKGIANLNPALKKNRLRLCTVGRLNPQKGYDRLLRIISKLKNEDKLNFELLILGLGPLEDEFKKFINDNNLSDTVVLLGYQSNPYSYIKSSDLFVCSSYKEGYSTVVTESVILGTPVITTNCSGMSEILDEGKCGIIVDNDEKSLYLGLKDLLTDENKLSNYKQKTMERSKFFESRNDTEAFDNLIQEVIN
ncbi:glycosyltransferase [Apibacter raozihei]|uniref:glycosyltransferase n=1 Tax=Apibacter raozihei TaxID=2500547 RepID=UPI000FE39277|nr:glycosyltransferase [Apibacter raozihei]